MYRIRPPLSNLGTYLGSHLYVYLVAVLTDD